MGLVLGDQPAACKCIALHNSMAVARIPVQVTSYCMIDNMIVLKSGKGLGAQGLGPLVLTMDDGGAASRIMKQSLHPLVYG